MPAFPELTAPTSWHTVEFISDLHLQPGEPETFAAWQRYLRESAADALFILGDLFEAWVGDDAPLPASPDGRPNFEARCAAVLRDAAAQRSIFFMHGNRDFLVGPAFLASVGVTMLDDPTVLSFAGHRWLLSHGDRLCLDDHDYLAFRAQVRTAAWQQAFLAQPLAARREAARRMRAESQAHQRQVVTHADVDAQAATDWLQQADAQTLIHGHTHRPAVHPLPGGRQRVVLSDWDGAARPPRGEVLRLTRDGLARLALPASLPRPDPHANPPDHV